MIFRAGILMSLDREERYREILKETREWVERSRNDRSRCLLQFQMLWALLDRGKYEENLRAALGALDLAERIGEAILTVFGWRAQGWAPCTPENPTWPWITFDGAKRKARGWATRWASRGSGWPWQERC